MLLVLAAMLRPGWQIYTFREGTLVRSNVPFFVLEVLDPAHCRQTLPLPPIPSNWAVTAAAQGNVTADGTDEMILLVWRPWRDWPIQQWRSAPSPIAHNHDAAGDSCHVAVLEPKSGREIWVGSALPHPLATLVTGDVDGDGVDELVALEGRYDAPKREGLRLHVWHWEGFGFTLAARSKAGRFHQLCLYDVDGDGTPEILAR